MRPRSLPSSFPAWFPILAPRRRPGPRPRGPALRRSMDFGSRWLPCLPVGSPTRPPDKPVISEAVGSEGAKGATVGLCASGRTHMINIEILSPIRKRVPWLPEGDGRAFPNIGGPHVAKP